MESRSHIYSLEYGQPAQSLSIFHRRYMDKVRKLKHCLYKVLRCPSCVHIIRSINMPAHVRTALTQTHLSIPLIDGKAALGQWQGIFLYEHRHVASQRRVILHLIGE